MSRNSRTIISLITATDLSQRMRSILEFGVAMALLMSLMAIAVSRLETTIIQSQISESFNLSSTVRSELVVHRAERGEWPGSASELANSTLAEESSLGAYVDHLQLGQDGALTAVFDNDSSALGLQERRLTFRPLTHPADPGAPVAWVCASHRYPSELVPGGIDETDIAQADLPSACRSY